MALLTAKLHELSQPVVITNKKISSLFTDLVIFMISVELRRNCLQRSKILRQQQPPQHSRQIINHSI